MLSGCWESHSSETQVFRRSLDRLMACLPPRGSTYFPNPLPFSSHHPSFTSSCRAAGNRTQSTCSQSTRTTSIRQPAANICTPHSALPYLFVYKSIHLLSTHLSHNTIPLSRDCIAIFSFWKKSARRTHTRIHRPESGAHEASAFLGNYFTASLSALPAVNLGTFIAGIVICSLVCGLIP